MADTDQQELERAVAMWAEWCKPQYLFGPRMESDRELVNRIRRENEEASDKEIDDLVAEEIDRYIIPDPEQIKYTKNQSGKLIGIRFTLESSRFRIELDTMKQQIIGTDHDLTATKDLNPSSCREILQNFITFW